MRAALAIALSLLAHALLAAAIAAWLANAPAPEALAALDLSSVELSLAEEENESAAVAPLPPAPPPEPPRPKSAEPPPEPPRADIRPVPPDPDSLAVREPSETVEPMREAVSPAEEKVADPQAAERSAPHPVKAPRQARVDAPPRPRKSIRPDYPKGARQRGEQGDVTLELLVGEDGAVGRVKVVSTSGFSELDEAAVRAARAARFTPAKLGKRSVASTARLKLTFRLR